MAKAPAFQFYTGDWLKDPHLQACNASTRGIWINLLARMWESNTRGEVTGTFEEIARLGGSTRKQLSLFMEEVGRHNFADVEQSKGVYIIRNRRMIREEMAREATRERVRKHRSVTDLKRECNTPSSSSSSSSCTKVHKGEYAALISSANEIKGWNFTPDEDADFFSRLLADFPEPLITKTIEDLRTYQERPAKQYKNLHSTLRNWCKREANRMEPEDVRPQAKLDPDGNPMYPLNGDWVTRKELDRMIAAGEVIRKADKWERSE